MDIKSLMVGDWVMQDDNLCNERKCRVMGIFDHCVIEVTGEKVPLHESHIKPIPLTKEILEKNGWPRRRWKYHLEDVFSDSNGEPTNNLIALWSYEDSFVLVIRGEECSAQHTETFDIRKRIRYVHELQHALRLCGIKKEIEL